jgi:hypothetical protein
MDRIQSELLFKYFPSFLNFVKKKKNLIIMYHGVDLKGDTRFNMRHTSVRDFETQIVFLKKYCNILSLSDYIDGKFDETRPNIAITFEESVCDLLIDSQKYFDAQADHKYSLKCRHSSSKSAGIFIDCYNLSDLSEIEIADLLLLAINTHLETIGVINFTLTPFERKLLTYYRLLKSRLPSIINKRLIYLKHLGNR